MSWSHETVSRVWEKGRRVYGENPRRFRKDACGAWIAGAHYGNRQSEFGWVVVRVRPSGEDGLENLVPLQWQNGVDGDGGFIANVVAERSHNVTRTVSPLVA